MWLVEDVETFASNSDKIINGLEYNGIKYQKVKTIPFEHIFTEDISGVPNFVYGSTITLKAAKKIGLNSFIAPTENEVLDAIGVDYLNNDMKVLAVDEVLDYMHNSNEEFFFIKPNADLKSFDGTVIDSEKFNFFIENAKQYKNYSDDTKICISGIKHIHKEWRVFVVNSKISTYSLYKVDRKIVKENSIPQKALEFVENIIDKFDPLDMYVVDVSLDYEGNYKVIEYNTINCSGIYDCDTKILTKNIESFLNVRL